MGSSLYRKCKSLLNFQLLQRAAEFTRRTIMDNDDLYSLILLVGQANASGGGAASSVGLMITLALFFHKAPEAAGYGTFLVAMK